MSTRFEFVVLDLLRAILRRLEALERTASATARDLDDLDRGLRPYGDGTKLPRRRCS